MSMSNMVISFHVVNYEDGELLVQYSCFPGFVVKFVTTVNIFERSL